MGNRSAPPASVTPVLSYPDVAAAVEWLTHTFGFVEHVRIGDHRAQMGFGAGALIVAEESEGRRAPTSDGDTHSVMVRVGDVDDHYRRVSAAGAHVVSAPETHAYGERQYAVIDLAEHRWTFTQSVADVSPETLGGATVTPW